MEGASRFPVVAIGTHVQQPEARGVAPFATPVLVILPVLAWVFAQGGRSAATMISTRAPKSRQENLS